MVVATKLFSIMLGSILSAGVLCAQQERTSLMGRVLDTAESPIAGALVRVTAFGSTATKTLVTDRLGRYSLLIESPNAEYIVAVSAAGYLEARRVVKRELSDERHDPLVADFRMPKATVTLGTVKVTAERRRAEDRISTSDLSTGASARFDVDVGTFDADFTGGLSAAAGTLPGVVSTSNGFSVLGLDAGGNKTTIGGLAFMGSAIPSSAVANISVITNSYDPARGGFSGAELSATVFSVAGPIRKIEVAADSPFLKAGRDATAFSSKESQLSLSALATNRLPIANASYSLAGQLARHATPFVALPVARPEALRALSLDPDSVERLLVIAEREGFQVDGAFRAATVATNASFLGVLSFDPTANSSLDLTALGTWGTTQGASTGPTTHPSASLGTRQASAMLSATLTNAFSSGLLSRTSIAVNGLEHHSTKSTDLASAAVSLTAADGSVSQVRLGGPTFVPPSSTKWSVEANSEWSLLPNSKNHRLQIGGVGSMDGFHRSENPARVEFSFASLGDFDVGRAATYSRSSVEREASARHLSAATWVSDVWKPTQEIRLLFGVRAENDLLVAATRDNPSLNHSLGLRTAQLPASTAILPSAGFNWSYGRLPTTLGGQEGVREARAVISGGIGQRRGQLSSSSVVPVLLANGLEISQSVFCVGDAAPTAKMSSYSASTSTSDLCDVDGTTTHVESVPRVILYERGYSPPKATRANLAWRGAVSPALSARFEVTQSWQSQQSRWVDGNFDATRRLDNSAELGRPIFVSVSDIVPQNGAMTDLGSRIDSHFGRVTVLRSDLQSTRTQFGATLSRKTGDVRNKIVLAYTYLIARDQVGGFSGSTDGDPTRVGWMRASNDGQHRVSLSGGIGVRNVAIVSALGTLSSGSRFTPMVDGDINGDGLSNDRAFIFNPLYVNDQSLAGALSRIMADSPARKCLVAQTGRVAAANSCRGPWTSELHLQARMRPGVWGAPQRLGITVSAVNVLSATDVILHGQHRLHGWGQLPYVDSRLLIVRGFDPVAKSFLYAANPSFGGSGRRESWNSSRLVVSAEINLGPDARRDVIDRLRHSELGNVATEEQIIRRLPGRFSVGLLALLVSTNSTLGLSGEQKNALARAQTILNEEASKAWKPLAQSLARLPDNYDVAPITAQIDSIESTILELQLEAARTARSILTAGQLRALPKAIATQLSEAYLRRTTGLFNTPR